MQRPPLGPVPPAPTKTWRIGSRRRCPGRPRRGRSSRRGSRPAPPRWPRSGRPGAAAGDPFAATASPRSWARRTRNGFRNGGSRRPSRRRRQAATTARRGRGRTRRRRRSRPRSPPAGQSSPIRCRRGCRARAAAGRRQGEPAPRRCRRGSDRRARRRGWRRERDGNPRYRPRRGPSTSSSSSRRRGSRARRDRCRSCRPGPRPRSPPGSMVAAVCSRLTAAVMTAHEVRSGE